MALLKGLKNNIGTLNSQKQENVQILPSVLSLMSRQLPKRLHDIKYNDYWSSTIVIIRSSLYVSYTRV